MGDGLKGKKKLEPNTYIQERERESVACTCMSKGVRAQPKPDAADTKQGTKKHIKKNSKKTTKHQGRPRKNRNMVRSRQTTEQKRPKTRRKKQIIFYMIFCSLQHGARRVFVPLPGARRVPRTRRCAKKIWWFSGLPPNL